jgi:hypothetical protein
MPTTFQDDLLEVGASSLRASGAITADATSVVVCITCASPAIPLPAKIGRCVWERNFHGCEAEEADKGAIAQQLEAALQVAKSLPDWFDIAETIGPHLRTAIEWLGAYGTALVGSLG